MHWVSHLVRMCLWSRGSAFKNRTPKWNYICLCHYNIYAICLCGNSNKSSYEVLRRQKKNMETKRLRKETTLLKKKLSFLSIVYLVFVVLCECGEKKTHWIYMYIGICWVSDSLVPSAYVTSSTFVGLASTTRWPHASFNWWTALFFFLLFSLAKLAQAQCKSMVNWRIGKFFFVHIFFFYKSKWNM